MLKIQVCGLSARESMEVIKNLYPDDVEVFNDPDSIAARKVKNGEMDYYLGSCLTGGGGSLAIAIPTLGYTNCLVVSKQGNLPNEAKIREMVYKGNHKAFGYVMTHYKEVVPPLVKALIDKNNGLPQ